MWKLEKFFKRDLMKIKGRTVELMKEIGGRKKGGRIRRGTGE